MSLGLRYLWVKRISLELIGCLWDEVNISYIRGFILVLGWGGGGLKFGVPKDLGPPTII